MLSSLVQPNDRVIKDTSGVIISAGLYRHDLQSRRTLRGMPIDGGEGVLAKAY